MAAKGTHSPGPAVALVLLCTLVLHGCAALPLAALGGAVLQSGAGAVVKTGTEYTMGGSAHRTFTIPINAVRAAVLQAFERAGIVVEPPQEGDDDRYVRGRLEERTVRVKLTAFSDSLTGLTLVVKRKVVLKDRATSSELLEQIEQALAENPTFARRLHRHASDSLSASPR
jgi:hypothetical protein